MTNPSIVPPPAPTCPKCGTAMRYLRPVPPRDADTGALRPDADPLGFEFGCPMCHVGAVVYIDGSVGWITPIRTK